MRNKLFFSLFGLALICRVVEDLAGGLAGVYQGTLFPWRHLAFIPLAPLWLAIVMWTIQVVAGLAFLTTSRYRRQAAALAFLTTLFSLSQMYQNQRLLLLAVSFLLMLGETPAVRKALKWQIIIVYLFSFLHKMEAQFWIGDVIRAFAQMLSAHTTLAPRAYVLQAISRVPEAAAVATLLAELLLPVVLITKPRVGFALVVILHAAFAAVMPDILTFGLTMAALASLYLDDGAHNPDQASNSALRA